MIIYFLIAVLHASNFLVLHLKYLTGAHASVL